MRFRAARGQRPSAFREVAQFERALALERSAVCRGFAGGVGDVVLVRVPARLDVMGGIADYCGAVVCEATLAPAVVLGIRKRNDGDIHILSIGIEKEGLKNSCTVSVAQFYRNGLLLSYPAASQLLTRQGSSAWAAYIAGVVFALLKEKMARSIDSGCNIVLKSTIPLAVGIGSSAAIEIATMHALNELTGMGLTSAEIARLCQLVENNVVGAPCGIMDQIVTACGRENTMLAIQCQPGKVLGNVAVPEEFAFAGINSNVKHSVSGSKYTDVRVGAFMGHKMILDALGIAVDEDPFGGYLANISPGRFRREFKHKLPSSVPGNKFLEKHGDTIDTATKVDPKKVYMVRSRTEHPVYENSRAQRFLSLCTAAATAGDDAAVREAMRAAGRLMYGSHWSYRHRCGLDSPETHLLVSLARAIGEEGGIYGAKITGGGSGGTVAVLGQKKMLRQNLSRIADSYQRHTGITPDLFIGSSPGAEEFGHRRYIQVGES